MPHERIEQGKRLRVCSICNRSFKRTEHCIRHERAHFKERPYNCRFCDRAYGRKDLLVRHERTLHADAWAKAQQSNAPRDSSKHPGRQYSTSNSADNVRIGLSNKPNPSHGRISIAEEAVIQNHSFLPSPRVSSSSDISEPDPASADAEVVGFHFPLDPALGNRGSMPTPMDYPHDPCLYPQSYDAQSRPVQVYQEFVYGDHMPTAANSTYSSHRHETYYADNDHIPVDPSLTGNSTERPLRTFTEHLTFFSLFPTAAAESAFANYVDTTQRSLNTAQDQLSSNPPPRPRGRPPKVPKISPADPSRHVFTEAARSRVISDITARLSKDSVRDFPSAQVLHRYFVSFLTIFNAHLPIFHVPSLSIVETPAPLLLSMCSIGALLQSEFDAANRLRSLANDAVRRTSTEIQRPLWEAQCILLSIIQAAFGGGGGGVRWAMEKLGFFRQEFASRRTSLLGAPRDISDWSTWIERESTKRLLLGMYVVSSLLNLSYDLPPCISMMDDLQIEMPASERIWVAPDAVRWQQEMASNADFHGLDVSQALTRLLYDNSFDPARDARWPAFAVLVLMHALNVRLWHVSQSTQSFENFAIDPKMAEQMKDLCIRQTEEAFKRCYRILEQSNGSLADSEGVLVFNGLAVLRSCFVRVFTSSGSFNRAALYRDDLKTTQQAAEEFSGVHQVRAAFVTKAVAKVISDLLPSGADRLGPLSSLEYILSVWDCALFSARWIHALETQQHAAPLDAAEQETLDKVRQTIAESKGERREPVSLAACVTRRWAKTLEESRTWEITRRMISVLHEMAALYENREIRQQ